MNKPLQKHIIKKMLGMDNDKLDTEALIDSSLTLSENLNELSEEIKLLRGHDEAWLKENYEYFKSMEEKRMNQNHQIKEELEPINQEEIITWLDMTTYNDMARLYLSGLLYGGIA